jgi:hypothetical protein
MSNPGYIYALINPALEGLVKVGKTTTNPANRANQLSSATGVPMQFMVAYSVIVCDCDLAEKYAHGLLEKKGYRVSSNREFFQAPLPEAIEAIKSTASFIGAISESALLSFSDDGDADYFDDSAWADLMREAEEYLKTPFSQLNDEKAIGLLNKAAQAGCVKAYYTMGWLHLLIADCNSDEPTFFEKLFGNNEKAVKKHKHITNGLECHRQALKHGYELSYAALAEYFGNAGNATEAKRHWDLFFQSNTFRNRDPYDGDIANYSVSYRNFLFLNLKMDEYESQYLADQKFDA